MRVTDEQIMKIVNEAAWEYEKVGDRTTLVRCVLPSGWTMIETSACIDPDNYDHGLGIEIARERIIDKLWELEGYRMMTASHELQKHLVEPSSIDDSESTMPIMQVEKMTVLSSDGKAYVEYYPIVRYENENFVTFNSYDRAYEEGIEILKEEMRKNG